MDWADRQYLEWYVCNHQEFIYQEWEFYDPIDYPGTWQQLNTFKLMCRMTLFANDKVRFLHMTDMRPGSL